MAKQYRPTKELRVEHQHLIHHLEDLRRTLDTLRAGASPEATSGLEEADHFLQKILKPHAIWEEDNLYPLADKIVCQHGKPSATMEEDHRELLSRIDAFGRELETIRSGKGTPEDIDRIRTLGYQIEAILALHFRKEENVYLDLIDRHAARGEVDALLKAARHAH